MESDEFAAPLLHCDEFFERIDFWIIRASIAPKISLLKGYFGIHLVTPVRSYHVCGVCLLSPGGGSLLRWIQPVITKSISSGDLCSPFYIYHGLTFSEWNSWSDLMSLACRQNTPLWWHLPSLCPPKSCSTLPQSLGFPPSSSFSCHPLTCPFSMTRQETQAEYLVYITVVFHSIAFRFGGTWPPAR